MNLYKITVGNKHYWATFVAVAASEDDASNAVNAELASQDWQKGEEYELGLMQSWHAEQADAKRDGYDYEYRDLPPEPSRADASYAICDVRLEEEDVDEPSSCKHISSGANG